MSSIEVIPSVCALVIFKVYSIVSSLKLSFLLISVSIRFSSLKPFTVF